MVKLRLVRSLRRGLRGAYVIAEACAGEPSVVTI